VSVTPIRFPVRGEFHARVKQRVHQYPAISTIVRQTCAEFAIPYVCYPTVWAAIVSHYRWLQTLGSRRMSPPNLINGTVPSCGDTRPREGSSAPRPRRRRRKGAGRRRALTPCCFAQEDSL
jgi:hypothetical protein